MKNPRFIISGGGTGGHIFPAISIANAIRKRMPEADILFVGALGKMEMERVPAAGYPIEGLPVIGFNRKKLLGNFKVLITLVKSIIKARKIIKSFKPNVVIGVGGYASAPTLKMASLLGVPTLIQEQNSYAGVTNKLLAKKAMRICVAYQGMEVFFPVDKITLTGNPVRQDLFNVPAKSLEAYNFFGLDASKKTLLIIGGSLGARTINQSIIKSLDELVQSGVQIIWQTGKNYLEEARDASKPYASSSLVVTDFVSRMDFAYAVADLVISRAGASSISELCLLSKPVVLVPSPNVAEDHQTKNAIALVRSEAAVLIKDSEAPYKLISESVALLADADRLKKLSDNIFKLAQQDSANRIVDEIVKFVK